MKKIWMCLCVCMMLVVTTAFAAGNSGHVLMSPDLTERVMNRLSGDWYDSDGKVALTIKSNKINDGKLVFASDFAGGDPGDGVFRVKEDGKEKDIRLRWYTYGNGGDHNYLVVDGEKTLRRTKEAKYYESVDGAYLGMSKDALTSLYGQPTRVVRNSLYYDDKGVRFSFQGDMLVAIVIYKGSRLTFDRTRLNWRSTLKDFKEAYHLKELPAVSPDHHSSNGGYDIGHGEFLFFDNYPDTILLTVYNQ